LSLKKIKVGIMSELHWKTAITKIQPNRIDVRGYRLDDLMGRVSFAQMVYLLFKGELPSENTGKLIEAILVSSVDHGTTPPSALSAMTVASTGAPLNASVAAGILAVSNFHGGAIEECMHILMNAREKMNARDLQPDAAALAVIEEYRERKQRMSGFGHRLHTDDPRTKKLFALAESWGHSGVYIDLAHAVETGLEKILGKKLPINVDGAIAAVLCELEFDPVLANAFFMIARVPGLVSHIYEETTRYKPMRKIHPTDVEYDGPEDRSL
jgi:citrate synthase